MSRPFALPKPFQNYLRIPIRIPLSLMSVAAAAKVHRLLRGSNQRAARITVCFEPVAIMCGSLFLQILCFSLIGFICLWTPVIIVMCKPLRDWYFVFSFAYWYFVDDKYRHQMDTLIMLVMLMGDQRYLWFSGITFSLELVCLINNYNHIPSIMIILYCMRSS